MDWLHRLQALITDHKIPIGDWARAFVDWLTAEMAAFVKTRPQIPKTARSV